jgi:hypothetical protein
MPKPSRVGEPVQVYLSEHDRALLEKLAKSTGTARSEVIRVALRRFAAELPGAAKPGSSLDALIGSLDSVPGIPADLAARHDEYLYGEPPKRHRRKR